MSKLNVAIADDNEKVLQMLDDLLRNEEDIQVAVSYTHLDVYKRQALQGADPLHHQRNHRIAGVHGRFHRLQP